MMSTMIAPADFADLCDTLYGPLVDADVVWEQVTKASPDQADLHAARADQTKRKITAGLSAVGAGAGALGLAVGAKEIRRHGWSKTPRLTRALVPVEIAGLGGEIMATRILHGDTKRPVRKGVLTPVEGVGKAIKFKLPVDLDRHTTHLVNQQRRLWKPENPMPSTHAGPAAPKAPAAPAVPSATSTPAAAQPQTRRAVKDARKEAVERQGNIDWHAKNGPKANAAGRDVGQMLSTKSGKAAVGTLGVIGARKVTPKRSGYEYVPDGYAKADTGDVTFRGEFTKFDDAKRQAFGWASVVTKDGSPVLDRQGDYITIDDLEDAAYTYVHKSRVGGDMHRRDGEAPHKVSDMIESMVFTPEKIAKMGLPASFPQGWWVGYQIHDEDTWQEVRKRGRTGFSIHGKGIRKDHALDDLMGY